jgi:ligand-binding sensor domain-containing protein/signal transduction histidine kinase
MMVRRGGMLVFTILIALGAAPGDADAERLPVRKYTTADGLAGDYTVAIYRDSRGFLWFSTRDGLSRFDGVRFTTYGIADGLPGAVVNRVLETRAGVYWIGTNGGGVCRFNPRGRRPTTAEVAQSAGRVASRDRDLLFTGYPVAEDPGTNRINVLFEDRNGTVWVGTDVGLFLMQTEGDSVTFARIDLPSLPADASFLGVHTIVEDAEGSLWIGGGWGLTRRLPDGRTILYRVERQSAKDRVNALLVDSTDRLWVGMSSGLLVLDIEPAVTFSGAVQPIERTVPRTLANGIPRVQRVTDKWRHGAIAAPAAVALWYTDANGLPHQSVGALHETADGHLWAGTLGGLAEFDGAGLRIYDTNNGLGGNYVTAITHDTAGNLWVGTVVGVTRIIRHGLITYGEADGLQQSRVHSLSEDREGRLLVLSGDFMVNALERGRFVSVRPGIPEDAACSWMSPCGYRDRSGAWLMLTRTGMYRLPPVARLADLSSYSAKPISGGDGAPMTNVFNAFEDQDGNLWVATAPNGLLRRHATTGAWRTFTDADGLPFSRTASNMASAFAQDTKGAVWLGFYDGGVARFRHDRFEWFGVAEGVPIGLVTALHVDTSGRLWLGSNQAGLARVDDPAADHPTFAAVASSSGLNVRSVSEDQWGRIYAGTSRGVYRFDPSSGRVEHFGIGEGLASDFVTASLRDTHGTMWFGTMSGVSRLDPIEEVKTAADKAPARVLISAFRVRGIPQRVSELGETDVEALTLGPDQNQLEIEYFGLAFNSGEPLKYQYRIEGIDDWSPPTDLRSVNYGRLAPGAYRFLVRSIRSDGVVSAPPALVSLTILPPIYARWWFISLMAAIVAAAGVLIYRARVAQLLRVERVRARIATDLHDDIGASLSQMAILAEVARQRGTGAGGNDGESLSRIAETSRGLVDSMSDIVWAVNPDADSLSDLVHRMRRFAEDTFSVGDVELTFRAPSGEDGLKLGADVRREVYLILKESVTNIAKHAACERVTIDFECVRQRLQLRIADNGRGFDIDQQTDGNGLGSMRRRVAALGGRFVIESTLGRGTTIFVELDLRRVAAGAAGPFLRL